MKTKKAVEGVKTALIAVLIAGAVFLGGKTGLFNDMLSALPFFSGEAPAVVSASRAEEGGLPAKEAARPLCIVITDAAGERYGVKYDTVSRNAIYDRTSSIFGEALGSASGFSQVSEEAWREALSGAGIYYEYIVPVEFPVLNAWLGVRANDSGEGTRVRQLLVAFGGGKNALYYRDSDSGAFYSADTASSAVITEELELHSANDVMFAYETGARAAGLSPYMLLTSELAHSELSAVQGASAEELLEIALGAIGHADEAYTAPFLNSEGTLTCVGEQFDISVTRDGAVSYRRSVIPRAEEGRRAPTSGELIEKARVIVSDIFGVLPNEAELFFESCDFSSSQICSVTFGYYIAGGRIHLREEGYAAKLTFREGALLNADVRVRSYSATEEQAQLLPEMLALAAAGGEFILCYSDSGQERLQPFWAAAEDNAPPDSAAHNGNG
ncbi:MAG: hypothetical protein FWG48_06860 [Oscillospiraceae bacterium]|nr:hypothetical protein [Oscillospiraceae bacterium]